MFQRASLMRSLGVENTGMLKGLVGAADFATSATVIFQNYNAAS